MLCYKDKSFCNFWKSCQQGSSCKHAYTDTVKELAKKCMLPVDLYDTPFTCYNNIEESSNENAR